MSKFGAFMPETTTFCASYRPFSPMPASPTGLRKPIICGGCTGEHFDCQVLPLRQNCAFSRACRWHRQDRAISQTFSMAKSEIFANTATLNLVRFRLGSNEGARSSQTLVHRMPSNLGLAKVFPGRFLLPGARVSLAAIDTAHTPYGTYVQVTRFSTSVFGNGLTIFFSDGQPESE